MEKGRLAACLKPIVDEVKPMLLEAFCNFGVILLEQAEGYLRGIRADISKSSSKIGNVTKMQ